MYITSKEYPRISDFVIGHPDRQKLEGFFNQLAKPSSYRIQEFNGYYYNTKFLNKIPKSDMRKLESFRLYVSSYTNADIYEMLNLSENPYGHWIPFKFDTTPLVTRSILL